MLRNPHPDQRAESRRTKEEEDAQSAAALYAGWVPAEDPQKTVTARAASGSGADSFRFVLPGWVILML